MRRASILPVVLLVACDAAFDIHAKEHVAPSPARTSEVDASSLPNAEAGDGTAFETPGVRPPGSPRASSDAPGRSVAFVARRFYFGARDPETGLADPSAWRRIGFDVDGVDTDLSRALGGTSGTCRRSGGVQSDTLLDGDDGRDNNFGSQILTLAGEHGASPMDLEEDASDGANRGYPTLQILLRALSDGPDDTEVDVGLFATVKRGAPRWDEPTYFSPDGRTVLPNTVTPRIRFEHAYMTNHVVVAGSLHDAPPAPFVLPLTPGAQPVSLTPLSLSLVLELDPGHHAVVRSTLSVVLSIEDATALLAPAAIGWGLPACTEGGQERLRELLRPLADLRSDRPSFLDESGETECDAISLAMQLGWEQSELPRIDWVAPTAPSPGGCGGWPL